LKTIYYGPRDRSKRHFIPIYEVWVEVVVTHDVAVAQKYPQRVKRLGEFNTDKACGQVLHNGCEFCLMVDRKCMSRNLIAHEVFHLTTRILERAGVLIDPDNHEAAAYLCGYLTDLVYLDLRKWKVSPSK
jgi:hypothetical protein